MWSGTVFVLPLLLPTALQRLGHAPSSAIMSAIYLGLLPSALGFVTWSYAVARLPVAQSTAALYLVPVVVLIVALVWLGERPQSLELLSGVIGIAGVVIINRWRPGVDMSALGDRSTAPSGPDVVYRVRRALGEHITEMRRATAGAVGGSAAAPSPVPHSTTCRSANWRLVPVRPCGSPESQSLKSKTV